MLSKFKQYKTSNRIYVLGSGRSILDISPEEWEEIKKHDSIGFNHWYVHEHVPTFYDLSYLANDYFNSLEDDMFYLASINSAESHFILNKGLDVNHLEMFKDRSYEQILINHFDLFEGDFPKIHNSKGDEIGKLAKYWTTEFFTAFNRPFGELLPNDDFIFKSRGQLFATIQIAVSLGYTDIRLIGIDLNDEGKFQDFYDQAPNSARSIGHGGENFKPRVNASKNAKDPNGVHNTCQATKDTDYLGIHKLISIFNSKCFSRVGGKISVCNPKSLLTSVGISYIGITEDVQMEKITFCIPSKSNVRYLKICIPSIRRNAYRKDHDIIVFVDSDEDGTVEWLEKNKDEYSITYYINPNLGKSLYGIGKAYDYCIEKSNTDIFMIFHADMILGKNADLNAFRYLAPKTVVSSTRIEPPLHPNAGEKILLDYGVWPEDFKQDEFDFYVTSNLDNTKTTDGVFAPWMMYKDEFLAIGGHDARMHSCREDSDVFNRLYLDGFNFIQPWSSLVYHFTGRGAGSFDGDKERHESWKRDMMNSTKEFIRKWGSNVNHTPLMKPIVVPKYNIEIRVFNATFNLLQTLEPWADNIYVDLDKNSVLKYIKEEQTNTIIPLDKKINTTQDSDIVVRLNGNTFNEQDFFHIHNLAQIITESGEEGEFELGNLFIKINRITNYSDKLINI